MRYIKIKVNHKIDDTADLETSETPLFYPNLAY